MGVAVEAAADHAVLEMLGAKGGAGCSRWPILVDAKESADDAPVCGISLDLSSQLAVARTRDNEIEHFGIGHEITTSPVMGGPGHPQLGVP